MNGYKLSPQQKHVWLLQENDRKSIYETSFHVELSGKIDVERLRTAIEGVVRSHEIFRTALQRFPGMDLPLQVVTSQPLYSFRLHDWTGKPAAEQRQALDHLKISGPETEEIDLEKGPLLYAHLIVSMADRCDLLLRTHAMCADFVSLTNLVTQIAERYQEAEELERGDEGPLQYADFAEWQNEMLLAPQTAAGRRFWAVPDLAEARRVPLPFELRGSKMSTFKPSFIHISLPASSSALQHTRAIAEQLDVPVKTVFLACWQVLLTKVTDHCEVALGIAVENRRHQEMRESVGLFAQILPYLVRLDKEEYFHQALVGCHANVQELEKWQEFFSWNAIPAAAESIAGEPYHQYCFVWHSSSAVVTPAFTAVIRETGYCPDRFLLQLACQEAEDSVTLSLGYDSERIRQDDASRFAWQYVCLLSFAARHPNCRLADLEMLSDKERGNILSAATARSQGHTGPGCVHTLFEQCAARFPDHPAVVFEGESLSYRELNRRANRVAHALASLQIGPESRVGLFMERSVDAVAALLGILKAGGAYVPLESSMPAERIGFMLTIAGVRAVVTQQSVADRLPGGAVSVLCIEALNPASEESCANPEREESPEQLAYVMFTSGSTGRPKGVAITQSNLQSYVCNITPLLNLLPCSGYMLLSTFASDLGNTVLFPALCTGGCIHVMSQERMNDPESLVDYFSRHQIDCLKVVPSHFASLLTASRPEVLLPKRCLVFGGESVRFDLISRVRSLAPNCRILNHYGPTETTVGVLTYEVLADEAYSSSRPGPPLGQPLGHASVYVLDEELEAAATWVAGEIYIGGEGVARGYINQAERTAERFVPDPYSGKGGSRLYRSGDRGRWLGDGSIEFLGRVDDQVKMRGYRIELGEIETVLREHAGVEQAVVVMVERDGSEGKEGQAEGRRGGADKRLVAYIVRRGLWRSGGEEESAGRGGGGGELSVAELRGYAGEKLPEYMVPGGWVFVEKLPLTGNGKVDRAALAKIEQGRGQEVGEYEGPKGEVEEKLAGVWREVLGVKRVGRRENFFELGGDSILSIQVVARAGQAGVRVTPRMMFQHQTIAELAAAAAAARAEERERREEGEGGGGRKAEQGVVRGRVELTAIQRWFLEQELEVPEHYNQAVLVGVKAGVEVGRVEEALRGVVKQHDGLRLRLRQGEQGWEMENAGEEGWESVVVGEVDLREVEEASKRGLLEESAGRVQRSMDWGSGCLVRGTYFRMGEGRRDRLLLVVHHLGVDGVSWRILLEDLVRGYEGLEQGRGVELGKKTVSFQRWAEEMKEYAEGEEVREEAGYWEQMLGGADEWEVPEEVEEKGRESEGEGESRRRRKNVYGEAGVVQVELGEEETRGLLQEAGVRLRAQAEEVLVAALAQVLSEWTGREEVVLEMEGHGREAVKEEVDVTRTVGWFTSLYPVRLRVGKGKSGGEVLAGVKERMRSVPRRGVGYGLLRYVRRGDAASEAVRRIAGSQVRFNYLGQIQLGQGEGDKELFTMAGEGSGAAVHPRNRRRYIFDITAQVVGGVLQINWSYATRLHTQKTVEALANQLISSIRALLNSCVDVNTVDFPEAQLTRSDLESLLAEIN